MIKLLLYLLPVLITFLIRDGFLAQVQNEPSMADYAKVVDILPPSPNSASLGRFGGIEVGLITGTISKNIPIYTLSSHGLQVPVSLLYSSNGLRVDKIASRGGICWNLNADGVITRTVYGAIGEESAMLIDYAVVSSGLVLPQRQYVQSGDTPLERRVEFFAYNDKGKITEQAKADDIKISYLWGYNSTYPNSRSAQSLLSSGEDRFGRRCGCRGTVKQRLALPKLAGLAPRLKGTAA